MRFLLDTCVISELAKRVPNGNVVAWLRAQDPESLYLSFVTIGELKKGIVKRNGDARALSLERWLNDDIISGFSDRLLPVDQMVALAWGQICGEAERLGVKRPVSDSLIAATALAHGMTVATRNVSDMAYTGVPVVNPFE